MTPTRSELEGAVRLERAYTDLQDARTVMTQALAYIDDAVDRDTVVAAMAKVDAAQSSMFDMVLEIYKRGH